MQTKHFALLFLIGILLSCSGSKQLPLKVNSDYVNTIVAWQQQRLSRLKAPQGWLSLIGLHWLKEGINTIGSANTNTIVFPENAPRNLGSVELLGDSLYFRNLSPATQVDKKKFKEGQIYSDGDAKYSMINYRDLFFYIIKRGEKYGVRLRDTNYVARHTLKEIPSFPIQEAWNKTARFIQPPEGTTIPITNAVGITEDNPVLAYLDFEHEERTHRLIGIYGGEDQYFLIIADATTSAETYGGGRFMYVDKADAYGNIQLDFNKAYNPPCVFTDFATCPLPPKENILPFRVDAGEKNLDH